MYTKDDYMNEYSKALGEVEARLLASLAYQNKIIFTIQEAQAVTGSPLPAVHSLVSGLVKKKWLIRLVQGKYLIVPLEAGEKGEHTENWFVIAKNLIEAKPYYISYYSALDIHEMVTQPVMTIYISTPIRRIPKNILGAAFRFIYTKPKDLWGIEDVWVTQSQKVKTSDLERTIIDCLDRPELCGGVSEVAKGIWTKRNEIDYPKLAEYSKKLGRKSIIKRLGFILETYSLGSQAMLSTLKQEITNSYTLLDPSLPASGRFKSSWKVRVNVESEELIEITKT
ncbi:MAG: type IV toxin-antitoxin system AbiEi family antitoxin domain-containing protein [Thermoleophilia bacterium]